MIKRAIILILCFVAMRHHSAFGQCGISITPASAAICAGESVVIFASDTGAAGIFQWSPATALNTSTGAVVNATPANTITYTAKKAGCPDSAFIIVTVKPLPVTNSGSNSPVCDGTDISLSANASGGNGTFIYQWSGPQGFVSTISNPVISNAGIVNSGFYSVTVTSNGCTASSSTAVTVKPLPSVSVSSNSPVCVNDAINLTALAADGNGTFAYQWNGPNSFASTLANPAINNASIPAAGQYNVTVTSNACTVTGSTSVSVNALPIVNSRTDTSICNGSFVNGINLSGTANATIFWYSKNNLNIGFNINGQGSIPNFYAYTNNPPINDTIIYYAELNGCQGLADTFVISIINGPVFTSAKFKSVCSGNVFSYTAAGTQSPAYTWSRPFVNGISPNTSSGNTNQISETLTNATQQPIVVNYIFTLSINGSCTAIDTVKVTVNPIPVIDPVNDVSFCNGEFVSGISLGSTSPNAVFTWTCSNTNIGLNASGSGSIPAFIATNSSANNISATVNVNVKASADSCAGGSINFTITILPSASLSSEKAKTVCDDALFNYTAQSATPGTQFSWTRDVVAGISNLAASGSDSVISETLNNTSPLAVVVVYKITLTNSLFANCTHVEELLVTVNPTPATDQVADTTFCNGELVSGINFSSASPNAAFNWTCSNTDIGLPASGSGNIPGFIAKDTTANAISATITVNIKASADSCAGSSISFIITVLPSAALSSAKSLSICDSLPFNYIAQSVTPGTQFSWIRNSIPGISNIAASGNDSVISETLDNTTALPIDVIYNITLSNTLLGCNHVENLIVTVFPTPHLDSIPADSICDGSAYVFSASSLTPGCVFSWQRQPVQGINGNNGNAGTSNLISETLNNDSTVDLTVKYVFTLLANGCAAGLDSFYVVVKPTPVLTANIFTDTICNNQSVIFTDTSFTPGTFYSWLRNPVTGILQGLYSGSSAVNVNISEQLTDTIPGPPIDVTYQITLTGPNGCPNSVNYLVTVYPDLKLNTIKDTTVCSQTPFVYQASSFTPNLNFAWQRDSVAGLNNAAAALNSNLINETFINISDTVVTTNYIFSFTSVSGCTDSDTLTVHVRPIPLLSSPLNVSVCSGAVFNYTAGSPSTVQQWYWKRLAVAGISNVSDSLNSDVISETLVNLTDTPVVVTYEFTLTNDSVHGCKNNQYVYVTVNPTPNVNSIADMIFCTGDSVMPVAFSSKSPATKFYWSNSNTSIGLIASGTDVTPAFVAVNNGSIPVNATITVFAKASNDSCQGPDSSFTIIVNPKPQLTSADTVELCSGNPVDYLITSNFTNDVTYGWSANVNPLLITGNSAQIDSIQNQTNNYLNDVLVNYKYDTIVPVTYNFTLTYTNQISCVQKDSIVVNLKPTPPPPHFTSAIADSIDLELCFGTQNLNFNINQPFTAYDSTYLWSVSPVTGIINSNPGYENTVISFEQPGNYTVWVYAFNEPAVGGCSDSLAQNITVKNDTLNSIIERNIIYKHPGNLLIYPDNSMNTIDGYQWGYDTVYNLATNYFGPPVEINNQVYQFFIPNDAYINSNDSLDTEHYLWWVALKNVDCITKVYYNGPYANKPVELPVINSTVSLAVNPNPNNGSFELWINGNIYGEIEATIYNALGKTVCRKSFEKTIPQLTQQFTTNHLANGIYLIELNSSDTKRISKRFIIQR